jgi:hypothetical protein
MLHVPNYSQYSPAPEMTTPVVTRRVSHTVVDGHRFTCVHTAHRRWVGYFPGDVSTEDLTAKTRKELIEEARAELQLRNS